MFHWIPNIPLDTAMFYKDNIYVLITMVITVNY